MSDNDRDMAIKTFSNLMYVARSFCRMGLAAAVLTAVLATDTTTAATGWWWANGISVGVMATAGGLWFMFHMAGVKQP